MLGVDGRSLIAYLQGEGLTVVLMVLNTIQSLPAHRAQYLHAARLLHEGSPFRRPGEQECGRSKWGT